MLRKRIKEAVCFGNKTKKFSDGTHLGNALLVKILIIIYIRVFQAENSVRITMVRTVKHTPENKSMEIDYWKQGGFSYEENKDKASIIEHTA